MTDYMYLRNTQILVDAFDILHFLLKSVMDRSRYCCTNIILSLYMNYSFQISVLSLYMYILVYASLFITWQHKIIHKAFTCNRAHINITCNLFSRNFSNSLKFRWKEHTHMDYTWIKSCVIQVRISREVKFT